MTDTPENQAVYPQPSSQAVGVGFALARLVMVICLASGMALDAAIGPHQGKGCGNCACAISGDSPLLHSSPRKAPREYRN